MFELENSYSSTRERRSQVTNLKIALKVTANFVTRCFNTVRENSSSKFEFRNTEITLIDCVRLWRYPLMAPLSHWQSIILTNIKALSGLIRFQKDLRPRLSFSYRFRPSTPQRRIRFGNAFIPSVRMLKELDTCAFQYNDPRNWREIDGVCPPFWILTVEWSGARSCLFDDITVFR